MIKFASKYLPALMKFMAKNDIRYYLMGIHIEPDPKGGAILCATDGHRMLVIKDKDASYPADAPKEGVIFHINKDAARFCKGEVRGVAGYATIDIESQRLTIFSGDDNEVFLQPGKCLVNGKFPIWQRVLPDFTKLQQSSLSYAAPEYISDAVMVHPGSGSRNVGHGCRFWQENELGPVIVEYSHHPEQIAIIMPLRTDMSKGGIDAWTKVFGNPKAYLLSEADQQKATP
jgi:hypothetical protein